MAIVEGAEVSKHRSADSCWVVIHGNVWDVTNFINDHPGGVDVIMKCAGTDATEAYEDVHNAELVSETLPAECCLGELKPGSLSKQELHTSAEISNQSSSNATEASSPYPPLSSIVNLADFEKVAEQYLSDIGWAYYSAGAEDELSVSDTRRLYNRIVLRPRVLRDVSTVSTTTNILGHASSLPFYISPTGMGKYAHRDAEKNLAAVAGEEGIIYMMPTSPSYSHADIFGARSRGPEQPLFFQLYFNRDHAKAEALVRKVEALGAAAIFVTVDSPVLGRRERDDRVKLAAAVANGTSTSTSTSISSNSTAGVAKAATVGLLNPALVWEDVRWLQNITKLPIVVKGVQSVEDAVLAHAHGVQGIVLSNHGGRSLDTAQAPLLTLLEIRRYAPHLLNGSSNEKGVAGGASGFQVFVDGGIRRGTDVIKALALGASAVGIGRPFLYSMTAGYGADGVRRLVAMLRAEIETSMGLVGATSIEELVPEMVNSERAENEVSRRVKL
ncbi:cytochrome b2 [Xylariales sp. PMI_506]|nr:cytochrome b2 [Xylariales sp. PMI_506]